MPKSISTRIVSWTKVFGFISVVLASGSAGYTIYTNYKQNIQLKDTAELAINSLSDELDTLKGKVSILEGKIDMYSDFSSFFKFNNPTSSKIPSKPNIELPIKPNANAWKDFANQTRQTK